MAWLGLPTLESSNDPEKAKEAAAATAAAAAASSSTASSAPTDGNPAGAASAPRDAGDANTPVGNPPGGQKEGVSAEDAAVGARVESPSTASAAESTTTAATAKGTSTPSGGPGVACSPLAENPTSASAETVSCPVGESSAAAAASAAGAAAALFVKEAGPGPGRVRARGGGWVLSPGGSSSGGSGDGSAVESRPDPMDEDDGSSGVEPAPSPKRKSSSSEGDDLMPSLKRARTPEEEEADAMDLADGMASGDGAVHQEAEEKKKKDDQDGNQEDDEDDDDEGPDSGDEGGGAVTDAAAAAGAARAARAAKRAAAAAAALAGGGKDSSSGPETTAEVTSKDVGEGGAGGGELSDVVGLRNKKQPMRKRAPLRDHIPEVDERTRPWLWNPPDYMWGDPGRFGGGCLSRDSGSGGKGGRRRADSSGASRRDGRDIPGVHARVDGELAPFCSVSCGDGGGGSGEAYSSSAMLATATTMAQNGRQGGTPPAERGNDATVTVTGMASTQATNSTAMDVDAGDMDDQRRRPHTSVPDGNGAGVEPSPSGDEPRGRANGTGNENADGTGLTQDEVGRDKERGAAATATTATDMGGKGTDKATEQKWAGLSMEGLKGSARWPIRKEPLMSAEYLAESGVLPKVLCMGGGGGMSSWVGWLFFFVCTLTAVRTPVLRRASPWAERQACPRLFRFVLGVPEFSMVIQHNSLFLTLC